MTPRGFAVPFACNGHGVLVAPEDARRGSTYRCPQCDGAVDLHAGERKRRHFHHRGSAACTAETVTHRTAKRLVVQAVRSGRAGGTLPCFVRRCASDGCERSTRQRLPVKVVDAVEELRLGSGRVVDVALVGRATLPIAAVEVRQTHEVDDAKSRDLPLPWIEVDAAQVCASGGLVLVPLRDRFLPWLCDDHAPSRRERARDLRAEPRRRAAVLRSLPFRLAEFPGFRVDRLAVCPNGHDAPVFAWDGGDPPWPRPPLVVAHGGDGDWRYGPDGRMRRLLPWRRRYVSACPVCGAVLV